MFHFPTFPPHALCVQARVTPHDWCGVPPFGHPRINARLAAPRGLSQPPTSFIGSWCPGIHRVPLTTWPHNQRPTTNQPPPHAPAHPPGPDKGPRRRTGSPRGGATLFVPTSCAEKKKDARVHCAVLNVQPALRPTPAPPTPPPSPHGEGDG